MTKNKKKQKNPMLKYIYSLFLLIVVSALIFNEFGLYKLYNLYSRKLDLDPELVNDPTVKNLQDVTMSYTFFSTDYYKQS